MKPSRLNDLLPIPEPRGALSTVGAPVCRGLADHGVGADAIHAELAGVERLAEGEESRVGVDRMCRPTFPSLELSNDAE